MRIAFMLESQLKTDTFMSLIGVYNKQTVLK